MNRSFDKIVPTLIAALAVGILMAGGALAKDETGAPAVVSFRLPQAVNLQSDDGSSITNEDTSTSVNYTLQDLQNAKALPLLEVVMPEGATAIDQSEKLPTDAVPGYSLGWSPQSGLAQPDPSIGYVYTGKQLSSSPAQLQIWGTAPTSPLNGVYGPFQRWTWYGSYISQDTQTIGKLFFDTDDNGEIDSSCTASVISARVIATAAHCIHSGGSGGDFYNMWTFCPSYYKGGGSGAPFPTKGCWSWFNAKVSVGWVNDAALDRDYACIITSNNGDTISDNVGNVTGWSGRAWNWSATQPIFSWGYPTESPFPGYHVIVVSGTEWYEVDMTSGDGQVSKYMGNDMTGGSDGGPWWISIGHRAAEYNDTDGLDATDPPGSAGVPGGPLLNGVNSHRRCLSDCGTPTATTGIFSQEMGSAEFRNTGGDTDESEDNFAWCFANE